MKLILIFVAILALLASVENVYSVVFTRCQLARELLRQGFPRDYLDDWVCLVESESSRNTKAINNINTDGSHDYGLFQINDRYWCSHGKRGNGCNMDCKQFLTDDITDASKCAKYIYSIHGFKAWCGWVKQCDGKTLPNIQRECGF